MSGPTLSLHRTGRATAEFWLTLVFAPFVLLFGLALGLFGAPFGIGLLGFLLLVASFFIPLRFLFWLLVIVTFWLAGPIQYFGHIQKIFWLPYLLGALLMGRALATQLFKRRDHSPASQGETALPVLKTLLWIWLLGLIASSLFNAASPFQVLLSMKEYLFMWGGGLVLAWGLINPDAVDRIFRHSVWFLLAQFPVILYQRFVVAAKRIGPSSWDSVVGLMSGDPNGGGASATMALIVILIMVYHLAAWRHGRCRLPLLLLVISLGLASIMLAEVKFAVLLIPLAFAMVYGRHILRRPLFGISFLLVALALGYLIVFAYQSQFAGNGSKASRSVDAYVEEVIERNTGNEQVNFLTGEMGRIAALKFWWANHSLAEPLHVVMGHGIGASRIGIVEGEIAKRFRFEVGRSTLVILLWEGGVLAATCLVAMLGFAVIRGFRAARLAGTPERQVVLSTAAIGLAITLLMMPYGPDLFSVSQAQLLAILLLVRILAARPNETAPQPASTSPAMPHFNRRTP